MVTLRDAGGEGNLQRLRQRAVFTSVDYAKTVMQTLPKVDNVCTKQEEKVADVVGRFAAPSAQEEGKGGEPAGVFLEKHKVGRPKLISYQCNTKRKSLITRVETSYLGKLVNSVKGDFEGHGLTAYRVCKVVAALSFLSVRSLTMFANVKRPQCGHTACENCKENKQTVQPKKNCTSISVEA